MPIIKMQVRLQLVKVYIHEPASASECEDAIEVGARLPAVGVTFGLVSFPDPILPVAVVVSVKLLSSGSIV